MEEPKDGLLRCTAYTNGFADGAGHRGMREAVMAGKYNDTYLQGYLDGKEAARQAVSVFAASIGYQLKTITIARRGYSEPPEDS